MMRFWIILFDKIFLKNKKLMFHARKSTFHVFSVRMDRPQDNCFGGNSTKPRYPPKTVIPRDDSHLKSMKDIDIIFLMCLLYKIIYVFKYLSCYNYGRSQWYTLLNLPMNKLAVLWNVHQTLVISLTWLNWRQNVN